MCESYGNFMQTNDVMIFIYLSCLQIIKRIQLYIDFILDTNIQNIRNITY